jgi:hypothetical protein
MLTGKPDDAGILIEGSEGSASVRWRFTEITHTTFTWTGHSSVDEGASPRLEH